MCARKCARAGARVVGAPFSCIFRHAHSHPPDLWLTTEGMKQENEFQRITLISLRSPTSGASKLGKPLSRRKLLFSERCAGGESIRRLRWIGETAGKEKKRKEKWTLEKSQEDKTLKVISLIVFNYLKLISRSRDFFVIHDKRHIYSRFYTTVNWVTNIFCSFYWKQISFYWNR